MQSIRIDRSLFGGWSLDAKVLDYLIDNIPAHKRILVIGSGATCPELAKVWPVTSIEHDPEYVAKYGAIHVPLVNNWYEPQAFTQAVAGTNPDVVIVDGPPGDASNRQLMAYSIDLAIFGQPMLWVVDDTHRENERNLAVLIQEYAGRRAVDIQCGQGKKAVVI